MCRCRLIPASICGKCHLAEGRVTQSQCCVCTRSPLLGKGPLGSPLHPGLSEGHVKCIPSGLGQFRCSRAVSLICRGALADGEPWRGAGRGAAMQEVEGCCAADTGINTPPQTAFFSPCCSQFHVVKIAQPFPYLCSLPGCVTSSANPFIQRFYPVSSLM